MYLIYFNNKLVNVFEKTVELIVPVFIIILTQNCSDMLAVMDRNIESGSSLSIFKFSNTLTNVIEMPASCLVHLNVYIINLGEDNLYPHTPKKYILCIHRIKQFFSSSVLHYSELNSKFNKFNETFCSKA